MKGKKYNWTTVFHVLCSTYGWTLSYVGSLNLKQIRYLLEAKLNYDKMIGGGNKSMMGKDLPSEGEKIKKPQDLFKLPMFKHKFQTKRKK